MKSFLIGLILGLLVGGAGALFIGGGGMMGAGVATGLTSGICMTAEAAQELGIMTAEQVDEVLKKAVENVSGGSLVGAENDIANTSAQCEQFLEKLRATQN